MQFKNLCVILTLLISGQLLAQRSADVISYINTYKELAIREMQRTGVPASITLAQGIHETMAGKSDLVLRSNNHFGIKCKSTWTGDKVYHDDDARGECFRSYNTPAESYADHSNFLKLAPRYAFLFQLDPTDYKEWAFGLKKAGYATNIKYSYILIDLVENYNLQQYTLIALGKLGPQDEVLAGNGKPISGETIAMPVAERTPAGVVETAPVPVVNYPAGEFTINNTKVVFAKSGTSLLSVARQYDLSLGRLLDFNDMQEEDVLQKDQLLFLQRKRKVGEHELHTVVPGESLYDICQAEGIRLESLINYNYLQGQLEPAAGEQLYLQGKAPARPKLAGAMAYTAVVKPPVNTEVPVAATAGSNINMAAIAHLVQSKETLYSIARKYDVTVEQLRNWNKLTGDELKIGQELVIYKN